ncbi:hypothetical protein [Streptomyces sp. YS415]|uniref:hypothetical protein n=1 Tax=Streptomyces sp. YS415 TaxID=2944806 RepID=UPI00202163F1|nr:hypothetical protein [Streptomyces sp. YS415]MCL7430362.1 hypothetical protein [Streptomyces sp. YS415]
MGLDNVTPISIDQMLRALAALGQEHVVDPEVRPNGLIKQDVPELLGALLGLVETETATVVDPMEDPPLSLHGLQQGWQHTSADRVIHRAVLTNRLRRTTFDIPMILADVDPDDEDAAEPLGIAAAAASTMAAAEFIDAQDHVDQDRLDQALGEDRNDQ